MSLVLRSSHFLRSLSFVSRKITLTARTQTNLSLLPATSAGSSHISPFSFLQQSQSFVTQAKVGIVSNDSPIDVTIRKLDEEARRFGRVSASEIKDILTSLNRKNLPTSTQALMLIRCCGNLLPEETPTTRTQIAQNLWQKLENLKVPLDVSHYNALLRVYLENEHTFSPTDILTQLETKGIEPNRVTYQRLISKYCQDGNIEGATKVLEFMRDKNFPITEGVFNALISGHSQSNDMASAEGILKMMSQAGLEPTPESYTTLLCGFAKQGDIESIRRILGQCEANLVNGDYLDIIHALAVNGQSQHIEELIAKIQPGGGYTADAANHIFHLINKGQTDTAYRIVKTLARPANINGEQMPVGGFLVRHLVKTNQPVEKILEICQRLSDDHVHPSAFNVAVQAAIECSGLDCLVTLLREYKSLGNEIRPHFFWPLLTREGKAKNTAEVLRILQVAQSEFNMGSSQETVRDYVLPHLSPPNEVNSELFSELRSAGVSLGTITSAYVGHMLSQNQLKEAARVASAFRARYTKNIIRKLLTSAYLRTQDLQSLVTVVKAVAILDDRDSDDKVKDTDLEAADTEEEAAISNQTRMDGKFAGLIVTDIFYATRPDDRVQHLEILLNKYVKEGIPLSRSSAEYIQNGLQSSLTSNISEALSTLTSEELVSKPLHYAPSAFVPKSDRMNTEYTLENIKKLESNGQNPTGLKRALFTNYIRQKEFEKAFDYFKVLEQDSSFTLSPGLYVLLIDLASEQDKLDVVTQYLDELDAKFPDVKMDPSKVLKVAHCFLKHGKETDAFDLLVKHGRTIEELASDIPTNAAAWRLLNTCAEQATPEAVKKLLDLLKTHNYAHPNNVILGPLIKAHVIKEDFAGALDSFEWCVTHYRVTPWKGELCRQFINTGDTASLQRITDLSTTIHGEQNSLYDLMLCFLESGRLRQARKILETPGMHFRPERLNQILQYYLNNKSVEHIENLLKVTQDLSNFDRSAIYVQLLELYGDDVDKALGLWTQMQEDSDTPSEEFLTKLAALLKKNNRPIPFSIPKQSGRSPVAEAKAAPAVRASPQGTSTNGTVRNYLRQGMSGDALKYYQNNPTGVRAGTRLQLVSHLFASGKKTDANQILSDITQEELEQPNAAKAIRTQLVKLPGEALEILAGKIQDESMRRLLSFSSCVMRAATREGKVKPLLASLKEDLEAAQGNEEKLGKLALRFPMSGILVALERHPELLPEVSDIAHKLAKAGYDLGLQALFNYYYTNGLISEAEQLFEKHLTQSSSLRIRPILKFVHQKRDLSLAEPLLKLLEKVNNTDANTIAYSRLILLALNKSDLTACLSLISRAADLAVPLSNQQLDRVQSLAAAQNQTIPLPLISRVVRTERKRGESSSSSDSEDEKEKVKRN